ncbi:hypothetical protein ACJMK2_017301 [Sinanodonta woodiana]|uniref:Sushi domain-containing protein n=1 Tax=Sinanodonta woodiana TaxID=1069815 RepID=A0ABD3UZT0_SINWO
MPLVNYTCLCPMVFDSGYIDQSCTSGMACNFFCNPGFVKTNNVLFCMKDEYWFPNTSSVCIKTVYCPAIFNNGYIQSSCSRLPGDSCNFICDPGFVKKGNQLTCGKDGMWIQNTNSICIQSNNCPDEFNGGYIAPTCSRHPGESCNYNCYPGFVKIGYWLICGNNGTWIQDTNSICIKSDPCPEVFNGGNVEPTCSRVLGNSCTFNCNPGFVKKGKLLTCGNFGNWFPDTNSICVQSALYFISMIKVLFVCSINSYNSLENKLFPFIISNFECSKLFHINHSRHPRVPQRIQMCEIFKFTDTLKHYISVLEIWQMM